MNMTKPVESDPLKDLADVPIRVTHHDGRCVAERDREPIVAMDPVPPARGRTMQEIVERIGHLRMPGDGFADDLEAIHAEQGLAECLEWPSDPEP